MPLWLDSMAIDVVGACICGGTSYFLYKALCSQQNTVQAMKAAPDLLSESIVNQGGQVMQAGITGYLRGTVHPVEGGGIRSTAANATSETGSKDVAGVVSQKTITEMIMTQIFGIWSSNERIINVECDAVPFYIVDKQLQVQIRDPLELDSVQLQLVGESYEAPTGGLFTSLVAMMQGFHTTGIKHTQEMLITGTEVVGLGRLVLKSSGFYLEPDPALPYIVSSHTKEHIIQEYGNWVPYIRTASWIFGSTASFFVIRLLVRYLKKRWSEWWRSANDRAYQQAITAAVGSETENLPEKLSCVACFGLRNAVLVPCAHVAVCLLCVSKVNNCPVCRGNITSVQPLIYS